MGKYTRGAGVFVTGQEVTATDMNGILDAANGAYDLLLGAVVPLTITANATTADFQNATGDAANRNFSLSAGADFTLTVQNFGRTSIVYITKTVAANVIVTMAGTPTFISSEFSDQAAKRVTLVGPSVSYFKLILVKMPDGKIDVSVSNPSI